MDYNAEIALLEREIEEKYDEIEHLKERIEKERREETIPVRNGHGQDYLDYEASTPTEEKSNY